MQKSHLFFALLALPLFAQGQTQTLSRQRVAFTAAPNVSYLASEGSIGIQMPQLGYHARLDGEWRLNQRLWLRVGAGYTLMRYKTDIGQFLQWPIQVISGVYDPSIPGESLITLRETKMLTLPVALRYFMDKKQRFYADLESGADLIFLQYNDVLRPHIGAALGFQFGVGRQNWLFIQPSFRLVLDNQGSKILKSNKMYPYSCSLEMGLRRGLR